MQLHFSGLCVLLTLLKANTALWKLFRLTFTSYTDVDECKDDRHDCHVNGTCTNTAGSFECVCNDGYFGDGRNCSGSHPDPEMIKGPISQKFFRPFGPPLGLKIRMWGGGGGGREGREGCVRGPCHWIRHWAQTSISTDQIIDTGQSHRSVNWIGKEQIDVLPFICTFMLTRLGQLNRII